MPWPSGYPMRTVTVGPFDGATSALIRFWPDKSLVWAATGEVFLRKAETYTPPVGVLLAATDQPGWIDAKTGSIIDVSAPDSHAFTYTARIQLWRGGTRIRNYRVGPFVVPAGSGSIDLDTLTGSPATPGILVPGVGAVDPEDVVAAVDDYLNAHPPAIITSLDATLLPPGSAPTATVVSGVLLLGIPAPGLIVLDEDDSDPDPVIDGVLYVRLGDPAPAVPTGLAETASTDTTVTLSWSAVPGAVAYQLRVDGGPPLAATSPQTVTGLAPATGYTVQVRAQNAAGTWSLWSATVTVTTSEISPIFVDEFGRADGPAGNGWQGPSGDGSNTTIAGGALLFSGWGAYNRAWLSGLPRNVSLRATFAGPVDAYQGIFLGYHNVIGGGIKLFNNGGTWVIGNSDGFATENSPVSGSVPSGSTALRLDLFTGGVVRAYAGVGTASTLILDSNVAALGITGLSNDSADVYRAGYCGEAKTPGLARIELWAE